MCDEAGYGSRWVDDERRLKTRLSRDRDTTLDDSGDEPIVAAAAALGRYRPEEIGVLASPKLSNEDLFVLRELLDDAGIASVDYRVPPRTPGYEDDFLIRADKNPNT